MLFSLYILARLGVLRGDLFVDVVRLDDDTVTTHGNIRRSN